MSAAFSGWGIPITFSIITQTIVNGFVQDTATPKTVLGTWQPLDPEQIKLKPEGQRSWEWMDFHVEGTTILFQTNDRLLKDGIKYKVMAVKDYRLNNYVEYHLIRDYQDGSGDAE